jgi:hypothetical protein
MTSLKRLFSAAPEGTAALFFIQIFSTLGFAEVGRIGGQATNLDKSPLTN